MDHLDNFKVILCHSYEIAASQPQPEYSVEAEYGSEYIVGKYETLAHHGDRSNNPAPCNTDVKSYEDVGGTIMISHIDTDTIGGIMAITGDKPDAPEFWACAEYIDVAGPHHIHELTNDMQDMFNAVSEYEENRLRGTKDEEPGAKDVTDIIREHYQFYEKILDREHPEHDVIIQKGREWAEDIERKTEERCVFENEYIRAFKTDGIFCAASYYSPEQDRIIPATVSLKLNYNSITIAFADGGIERGGELSAREIVQDLWGKEAGGHDGIAGSPRGREMTEKDFEDAKDAVIERLLEHERLSREKDKDFEIDR